MPEVVLNIRPGEIIKMGGKDYVVLAADDANIQMVACDLDNLVSIPNFNLQRGANQVLVMTNV